MSHVEVRQIGHVAATPVAKTLTANGRTQNETLVAVISDSRWIDSQGKTSEKATAITWTLLAKVAVNVSWHLDVGSKVAVVGTLEGNRYTGKDGKEVFGFNFTARSVEYLESNDDAEARRNRRANAASECEPKPARSAGRTTSRSSALARGSK
jgi:single-stranded DNA-binding protein